MQRKVTDYAGIIKTYNEKGAKAASKYIQAEFAVTNPGAVLKRMRESDKFHYDKESDRFGSGESDELGHPFLSLDELCHPATSSVQPTWLTEKNNQIMEHLVKTLIEDRLLQLSKYVQLNQAAKQIRIDRSTMLSDGFEVIIH